MKQIKEKVKEKPLLTLTALQFFLDWLQSSFQTLVSHIKRPHVLMLGQFSTPNIFAANRKEEVNEWKRIYTEIVQLVK